ncbi:MAG: sensor histidine kinase [Desulfobacteria bacterium]
MHTSSGSPAERIRHLNEAFSSFTVASGALEQYYEKLQETVRHLTIELRERNAQLKTALTEAETAKDNLRCVLQSMDEVVVVLDPDGNMTMANRAATEMLGPAVVDGVGKPLDSLGFSLGKCGADAVLVANGKRYDVIASRSNVVDPSGMVRGSVLLVRDVTKMKELESQFERNRRLIRMGEMAAKIVHEIRNPLCSIELYATMLESGLGDSEEAKLARGISSGIRSLNNILTNMLLFAKRQKPFLTRVDTAGIVDEALFLLEPMIGTRGVRIEKCVTGAPCLDGDPELLKQVLLNVLLNAIHATPAEGRIRVAARGEDDAAVIEVSDEGEGIREEDRERIFDPFFSTKVKGTGLGLAITSRIMEAHGGFIRVRSEVGKGSVFALHFPPAGTLSEGMVT